LYRVKRVTSPSLNLCDNTMENQPSSSSAPSSSSHCEPTGGSDTFNHLITPGAAAELESCLLSTEEGAREVGLLLRSREEEQ